MHTFLKWDLLKVRNYLPNTAIRNSIQTGDIFLQFPDFCVLDISKTNKVRNLKQTPKVAHIIHMQLENIKDWFFLVLVKWR